MGSRIRCRKGVKKLFECFMVIKPPWGNSLNGSSRPNSLIRTSSDPNGESAVVEYIFPPTFKDQEILKSTTQFAFPCPIQSEIMDLFTFALTSGDSKYTFGYCRYSPGVTRCTLFLSFLPWQEIFYRSLNYCAELQEANLISFLERMFVNPVPDAGTCLYIPTPSKPFICPCPSDFSLPSIPENRNINEFYNALSTDSMLTLFAALLSERRIVVTSKKLSRLSSIVVACNLFLFPMSWQHIFIPLLPLHLQDYLAAPMPFLIGVPLLVWDRFSTESLGQVVRVDADTDTVCTPFPEDLSALPDDIVNPLRKNLTGEKAYGDGIARAFLRALAQLMGHYNDAIREDGSFSEDLFVSFAHSSHRLFIQEKLLKLQIFHQFVEERLEKIKEGSSESDEFELESLAWRSSRANGKNGLVLKTLAGNQNKVLKKAGKAVIMSVKREGGNLIESVKQNSALKSAYRTVKEGGKTVKQKGHVAYADMKSKFHVSIPSGSQSRSITAPEYGHTSMTKSYLRHPSSSNSQIASSSNQDREALDSARHLNDNMYHHMMSSCSASNLPRLNGTENSTDNERVRPKPRLSKSEENLIDLDTPDGLAMAGYTLENPLYDLVENNSVFEEIVKTDDQLLKEYGLNDYFLKLNIRDGNGSFSSQGSDSASGVSQQNDQLNTETNGSRWATFD